MTNSSKIVIKVDLPNGNIKDVKQKGVTDGSKDKVNGVDHEQATDAAGDDDDDAKSKDGKGETRAGMVIDSKNLYQSKPDSRGRTTWVDQYPEDLPLAAENDETAKFALLIRNRKCFNNSRKALEIDSIIVQSPLLKRSLGSVLKDYPGVTTTLDRLTFNAPFKPFVHRWKRFQKALNDESDPEAKSHLTLLHKVLEKELRDDLKALEDYILNGVITYSTAWMIFEPGEHVFGKRDEQPAVASLYNSQYAKDKCGEYFGLQCNMVDWDGERFGMEYHWFKIRPFDGTARITKLSAFPLTYHPKMDKVRNELIERGKQFQELSGYHYKYYKGIAVGEGMWGPIKYNIDSRIIIDTYAWNRFNPNRQVNLNNLDIKPSASSNPALDDDDDDASIDVEVDEEEDDYCSSNDSDDDYLSDPDPDESSPALGDNPQLKKLTETQLLMCKSTLRGYSLKTKKWLTFSISHVKPITFNANAFENLVLPADHKELILALTQSQAANKASFDDIIAGKGRGMILLLSGPPGVGKTLTAESVAEYMQSPLYMMSAGDLGLDSSEVESGLSNVLEMATKWNAILLLDEADVFLEQRSSHGLERNKLVSIFLRMLEYYEGILFLTTNRVDNIDAAFQSRIHISMQYSDLNHTSRRHIWKTFTQGAAAIAAKAAADDKEGAPAVNGTAEKEANGTAEKEVNGHVDADEVHKDTAAELTDADEAADSGFSDADLDAVAEYHMNGREIKNVLKTAQLLASKKGEKLGRPHVVSVMAIEQRHVGKRILTDLYD